MCIAFGKTNGSDRILLNEKAKSVKIQVKKQRLEMQP